MNPEDFERFIHELNLIRHTYGLALITHTDIGCQAAQAHCDSMRARRRLTYTRSYRDKGLKHLLGFTPWVQTMIIGQASSPQGAFKLWSTRLDDLSRLCHPRVDHFGLACNGDYWVFVAYRERKNQDHRRRL